MKNPKSQIDFRLSLILSILSMSCRQLLPGLLDADRLLTLFGEAVDLARGLEGP